MRTDIESWENHAELHDREDYPALVELCKSEVASSPEDLHAIERLAQAYILNTDFAAAIQLLTPVHNDHPDLDGFSHLILDALFGMGKTESDFKWISKPRIFLADGKTAEACHEYLNTKRKPRSVNDIYVHLILHGYLAFNEIELVELFAFGSSIYNHWSQTSGFPNSD